MMQNIHDIYDKGYKKLFSNKTIFRQLLETFVQEAWVKEIDFKRCETLDKSFVSDHYKEAESDLIYKLKLKGKAAYIVILLEFQSTIDRFMALRVLNYITNFYMDYVQSHKRVQSLPPVFPIVLYSGKKKWTAPVKLSQVIQNHDLLGRFAIGFEYLVISEQAFPKERLLQIHNFVSTLFLAETHNDIQLLVEEFSGLFDQQKDRQAFWLLVNWFLQLTLHGKIAQEHYNALERVITTKEEVRAMLIETIEQERKKFYEQGRFEGKLEGQLEGKLEDAKAMVAKGIAVSLIAEITGLGEEVILRLRENGNNFRRSAGSNN